MNQTEVMLELLRAAVFGKSPIIPEKVEIDWDDLMTESAGQGIMTWVWDGICKLPIAQQPPRQYRINWGMSVQQNWDNYKKHYEAIGRMIARCNDNDMRLLLLKGIGLSHLYPKPESRPCGDIDIYMFKDYSKCNRVFTGHDIERLDKHATFFYNDILVENHYFFLEPNTRLMRAINTYLVSTLDEVRLTQYGYYVFSPIPNLVFLTMHTLKHFREAKLVPYRNVLDFGMFLYNYQTQIPPSECLKVMSDLHLEKGCEMLVYLSEMILGIDFEKYHFHQIPLHDIDQIVVTYFNGEKGFEKGEKELKERKKIYHCIWRYVPRYLSYYVLLRAKVSNLIRSLFCIPASSSIKNWIGRKLFGK